MIDSSARLDATVMFQDAPCGLVMTEENGTIVRANAIFCEWLGYSEAELQTLKFQSLLTMGGRIFHQTHWAPLMKMQGSVAEIKLDLVRRDKQSVTALLNGVRREHVDGVVYELALFVTTERDNYERELLKARTAAEKLLEEKTAAESALRLAQIELSQAYELEKRRASLAEQMMAIVSHDLKNPLTAIKMAAGFLSRSDATDRESKMIGHISESADRAERMIADLLDLALAREGRGLAISPSPVDLHPLISKSVDELRVTFPTVILHHNTQGSGHVEVDADRLQQVIGNLAANSVAYGDLQQPITITSQVDHDRVVVSVHNHGPAIAPSLMVDLFEPMTRGAGTAGDIRSVGLGLFIVSEIAKAHGGKVLVTSTDQHGTTFDVCFPRATPTQRQPS